MYRLYANNEHIMYWVRSIKFSDEILITEDFGEWISNPNDQRISLIYVTEDYSDSQYRQNLRRICDVSDLTILFLLEFTDDTWCHDFDRPNVIFMVPGRLNWHMQSARQMPLYQGFIADLLDFYRPRMHLLDGLHDGIKPKYFDALLGRRKWHRTQIFEFLDPDQNFVTYFGDDDDNDIRGRAAHEFSWPLEILPQPDQPVDFTMQRVLVDDHLISLSMLVPVEVYNQTYYSIVPETIIDNRWSFFTEKIAKPMLARRLFLVLSGQHYLRNLRELGFKTFSDIIDESYDEEPDSQRRINMVFAQMTWLQQQDPKKIQDQAKSVLEHNHQHLIHTPWEQNMLTSVQRNIEDFLRENKHK